MQVFNKAIKCQQSSTKSCRGSSTSEAGRRDLCYFDWNNGRFESAARNAAAHDEISDTLTVRVRKMHVSLIHSINLIE